MEQVPPCYGNDLFCFAFHDQLFLFKQVCPSLGVV